MKTIGNADIRKLAVFGARTRLVELQKELAALTSAFPELKSGSGGRAVATQTRKPGRKTPMTAAERRQVSLRMKKYWAARRAAAK